MFQERKKEEYVIVLDFLPNGYAFDNSPRKTPIIQGLGKEHFSLLEIVPKKGVFVKAYEEIYIGEGKRDKVHHINGKLPVDRLTQTAKSELEFVIVEMVNKREKEFVDFFNNAQPLSTRMHSLELLPGLGKKHMWEIVEERRGEPFKSFEDIKKRVKLLPDPKKLIIKRIINEVLGKEKHMLFVG
jgi:putative nucleotide binding protein